MVVFTCNNCGDSLQKPKVAKHYQFQCRKPVFVTCVDCFKDFRGEEYVAHTKCITENERYGGKDYVAKPSTNKGERKQQAWLTIVQNVLSNSVHLTVPERNLLNSISKHDNIPRKKVKFLNFIKSMSGNRVNMSIVESVWDKMEKAFKEASAEQSSNNSQKNDTQDEIMEENQNNSNISQENDETEGINNVNEVKSSESNKKKKSKKREHVADENEIMEENQNNSNISQENNETEGINNVNEVKSSESNKKKKSKKREHEADENDANANEPPSKIKIQTEEIETVPDEEITENGANKFSWKNTILEIVKMKGEISLKKLRKKAVAQYLASFPDSSSEKATTKFEKKLNKVSDILVAEDKVSLASS